MMEENLGKLISLGLSEQKAKETLKNANVTKNLLTAFNHFDLNSLPEGAGMLIYQICTKIKPQILEHLPMLVKNVANKKLDTQVRIEAALEFVLTNGVTKSINTEEFEKACGVGIVVSPEEIDDAVSSVIKKYRDELIAQRYRFNVGKILMEVRGKLPWADGKAVKNEVDVQIFDLLGPKTDQDLAPPVKEKKGKEKEKKEVAAGMMI